MRKRQKIAERQSHVCLPFWQRLILVSALIVSTYTSSIVIQIQYVYSCHAGNGGNGGTSIGGANGSDGGIGGDCINSGYKSVTSGGTIQNNGGSSNNQANTR